MRKINLLSVILLFCIGLASCGGGGGSEKCLVLNGHFYHDNAVWLNLENKCNDPINFKYDAVVILQLNDGSLFKGYFDVKRTLYPGEEVGVYVKNWRLADTRKVLSAKLE